jgi:cation diffusion facilitator CzcD-associated flavoprotein CzcO
VRVFGEPMESWEKHMPVGMLLRSLWSASYIGDPDHALGLDAYEAELRLPHQARIPRERFVEYGRWFQRRAVPNLERRRVAHVERDASGFRLRLEDGEALRAKRVIVATGIVPFAWRPPALAALPSELVSHAADHGDLSVFVGRRVVVLGGGQSALESAALLAEAGADVEVLVRGAVSWHTEPAKPAPPGSLRSLRLYAYRKTALGGPRSSWVAAMPALCRLMTRERREHFTYRIAPPAGAVWLRPRLADVPITVGRTVDSASRRDGRIALHLSDGSTREANHVLVGTGYQIDLSRYRFLPPELLERVDTWKGSPLLSPGFESSVPGLHFVGATAALSFGPVMRFVCGTWAAARGVTRGIAGRRAPRAGFTW